MVLCLVQILELDTAWRQRMQKEQVAHLAHTAQTRQASQQTTEQQLLQKERTAAKQVCPCFLSPPKCQSTEHSSTRVRRSCEEAVTGLKVLQRVRLPALAVTSQCEGCKQALLRCISEVCCIFVAISDDVECCKLHAMCLAFILTFANIVLGFVMTGGTTG